MGNPKMSKVDNWQYRKYRVNLARRAEARERGKVFVVEGYEGHSNLDSGPHVYDPQIIGYHVYYHFIPGLRQSKATNQ